MPRHFIRVLDIQGTAVVVAADIMGDIQDLVVTQKINGGCMDASFKTVARRDWRQHPPSWLRQYYRMDICDASGCWWRGWIDDIGLEYQGGETYWTAHCMGIGAYGDDMLYAAEDFAGLVTSTAMGSAVTDLLPSGITQDIDASGVTLSAANPILFSGKGSSAFNWLSAFGDSNEVLYSWALWPGKPSQVSLDGDIVFEAGPRSSTPQYYLYLKTLSGWRFKSWGAGYFNRVRVWYNSEASSRDVNDTDEQSAEPTGVNRTRTLEVFYPALTATADVDQVGTTLLNITKQTRMIPESPFVLVGRSVEVLDEYNNVVPLYKVRPGKLVALTDIRPSTGQANAIDFLNSFYIAETDYNVSQDTLKITPESLANALQPYIGQAYNLLTGRQRL